MSCKKDLKLREFLENNSLENYYESFQEQGISFVDLEFLESDDIEGVVAKKFHRKRFLKSLESLKTQKKKDSASKKNVESESSKNEKGYETKEEVLVQMLVKSKDSVKKIYDLPLGISNGELLLQLQEELMGVEVKLTLPDKTVLTSRRKLTLEKWLKNSSHSPENEIRGVLSVKGVKLEGGSSEEEGKLRSEIEELKKEKADLEMSLKKVEEQSKKLLDAEKTKLRKVKEEYEEKYSVQKREAESRVNAEKARAEKLEIALREAKKRAKSTPGISLPQNARFLENSKFRDECQRSFSHENKVAKVVNNREYVTFKASPVFTAGKKFYFQTTATIAQGIGMGVGVMSGEVSMSELGSHQNGWNYDCAIGYRELWHADKKTSEKYGPERKAGKATIGLFCDFTDGKGELSFIVDGKNWGVAFDNVKPPVSPAFTMYKEGDAFKIDEVSEVPDWV